MAHCLIFPGQGTQFQGMASTLDLRDVSPVLLNIMEHGPEEELNRTVNAQPAVLATSIALWSLSSFSEPDMVMGHSLGEYSALVAAGSFSLKDALSLVEARAKFMEDAQPKNTTGMAAVLEITSQKAEEAIQDIDDVWVANLNGGGQVVISGKLSSIEKAVPKLKDAGAKRVILLKVSVASHCPLMEPASKRLRQKLDSVEIKSPKIPVIFNVTADTESDPDKVRELLSKQLIFPVRWEESVKKAISMGATEFLEIGPKSVLAPLVKKISQEVDIKTRTIK